MNNIVPKVSTNEFDSKLTEAINGNQSAIKFIDSLTINRADGMGFDMFSKESFWSNSFKRSDSICAVISPIYSKYRMFRNNQQKA